MWFQSHWTQNNDYKKNISYTFIVKIVWAPAADK